MAEHGADIVASLWRAISEREISFGAGVVVARLVGLDTTEPAEHNYLVWLAEVDRQLTARYGVTVFDIPDRDYPSVYARSVSPSDVVTAVGRGVVGLLASGHEV